MKIKEEDSRSATLKLKENWQVREILKLIRNDESIQVVQEKPIILRWKGENNSDSTKDQIKEPVVDSKEDDNSGIKQDQKDIGQVHQCDGCDGCEGTKKKIFCKIILIPMVFPQLLFRIKTMMINTNNRLK